MSMRTHNSGSEQPQTVILINRLTGAEILVHAYPNHPLSRPGYTVWADEQGVAYGQVGVPVDGYDIKEVYPRKVLDGSVYTEVEEPLF